MRIEISINSIEFGAWIRNKREERRISQGRLAKLVRCHENSIGRWERGEQAPPLDMAERIAKNLGAELIIRETKNDKE